MKCAAPYIADRNKLADAPAVAEFEIEIPQSSNPDQPLSIPQGMMPSDEQALHYFHYFFTNIHPYVPVLNRQSFYQQWTSNRNSISPLLLEAIFACTTMTLENHEQGNKWLALANSTFVPFLVSTVILTCSRTRRKFQGRASLEHHPGLPDSSQSSRRCAEERLFLSLLDDSSQRGGNG